MNHNELSFEGLPLSLQHVSGIRRNWNKPYFRNKGQQGI